MKNVLIAALILVPSLSMAQTNFVSNVFACSIEGSTRKHVIEANNIQIARKLAALRLTESNLQAGDESIGQISIRAVHCMELNGILDLEKIKDAFGSELFVE